MIDMKPQVEVVFSGWLRFIEGILIEAHSSVTLIRTDDRTILVDTSDMNIWDEVKQGLDRVGVAPEEVDTVLFTHLHADHASAMNYFSNAEFYAHELERPVDPIHKVTEEGEFLPGIELIHTPGHTEGCMTVLVDSDRRYAIVGDALPTKSNYVKWVPHKKNIDYEVALDSMQRIVDRADVIIPGHDVPFEVDRKP